MELITRSDDERLEITSKEWFNTLKHNDPLTRDVAKVVCFFIDSLRAALKERDDERKAKYCEREFKEMAMKELNEALSRIRELEAENKRLRFDLSKPPQEREYCAGRSLPSENKRLKEAVEWACHQRIYTKVHRSYGTDLFSEITDELRRRAGKEGG